MARHELTREERSKGAQATAAVRRAKRDEREQAADERFAQMLDKAYARHEALLASDDDAAAARAIREVYDRYLGRPSQRIEHEGEVAHTLDARPRLAALLADRSARARTKDAD